MRVALRRLEEGAEKEVPGRRDQILLDGIRRWTTEQAWWRWLIPDQHQIDVPTLIIGARYDTMDPAHMEMMAGLLPRDRYLYCPEGSHLAMYDDQQTYFAGLIDFLRSLPARS